WESNSPTNKSNNSDKSLSLTAKQTFGIPQQGVCRGLSPTDVAGANPSPNPKLWGLSPTGITLNHGVCPGVCSQPRWLAQIRRQIPNYGVCPQPEAPCCTGRF